MHWRRKRNNSWQTTDTIDKPHYRKEQDCGQCAEMRGGCHECMKNFVLVLVNRGQCEGRQWRCLLVLLLLLLVLWLLLSDSPECFRIWRMVREFVKTILEWLVRAALLRRSRGGLEHGSADVCEGDVCLVLVYSSTRRFSLLSSMLFVFYYFSISVWF